MRTYLKSHVFDMAFWAVVDEMRGAAPPSSEKTHSSHALRRALHSCSASVPTAPAAQCWTGAQYMLLMIQWISSQPSGVCERSKHSNHAKIDYLSLEWSPRGLRHRSGAAGLCNTISLGM